MSNYPQVADIKLKNFIRCRENYNLTVESLNDTICAGELWQTVKSKDKGGPLLVHFHKRFYLVGIIGEKVKKKMADYDQDKYPVLFTRIKAECGFFKNETNFECYKNKIPFKGAQVKKPDCGYVTSYPGEHNLHPWYCRIYDNEEKDFCGATLISFKHAITAAHCIESEENFNSKPLKVRCGAYMQKASIKKVTIFPGYTKSLVKDDIAILELSKELEYDGETVPICLPGDSSFDSEMTAVGIGHDYRAHILNERTVSEFSVTAANNRYCVKSRLRGIDSNTICTKATNYTVSKGESGGPLVRTLKNNDQKRYYITGVISQGNKNTDAVSFTNV
ncbi:hypothetical protein FO519_010244, partial [Halicephalobus sp. NKZ332]